MHIFFRNLKKNHQKILTWTILAFLSGIFMVYCSCSPGGRLGKEKYGQVPCPCEKRNSRR